MLIPRIFHQIWVGPDPLPEEHARYQQTWLDHHPGWELRLWTDDDLPDGLRRPEAYERLRSPVERGDILRLELVCRFGGVHVDTDFECLRSIEPLIEGAGFFIGRTKEDRSNNALFGAVAEHPILVHALEEIRPRTYYGYDKEATGPKFFDTILAAIRGRGPLRRAAALLRDDPGGQGALLRRPPRGPGLEGCRPPADRHGARGEEGGARAREGRSLAGPVQGGRGGARSAEADMAVPGAAPGGTAGTSTTTMKGRAAAAGSLLRSARGRMSRKYPDLQVFCLFVGPPRQGTSLVGALLDAHPDIVIGHETHVVKLAAKGASREVIFQTLLEKSRDAAGRGRKEGRYTYAVEGQWQGRVRTLRVIGDKASGKTAVRLNRNPAELTDLERKVRVPVRFVHVTRNPFDTIARMSLLERAGEPAPTLTTATEAYAILADATANVVGSRPDGVVTVRHESVVETPALELRRLCAFFGVEADAQYLEACAGLVFPSPRRSRDLVEWSDAELRAVEQIIARHEFLHGYSWAGGG